MHFWILNYLWTWSVFVTHSVKTDKINVVETIITIWDCIWKIGVLFLFDGKMGIVPISITSNSNILLVLRVKTSVNHFAVQ